MKKLFGLLLTSSAQLAFFSIVGQAIGIVNFILAANWYGQDLVGIYSVFLSISAILSSINLLSLEKSIPNLDDNNLVLFVFGTLSVLMIITFLSLVGLWFFDYQFYILSSIYIMAMGVFRLGVAVNIRNQSFKLIMMSRVFPSAIFFIILIIGVVVKRADLNWLISGQVLSMLFFVLWYERQSFKLYKFSKLKVLKSLKLILTEWKFMVYVSPSELVNRMAFHLPVIIIERYFGSVITAQYSLVLKICLSPLSIICTAVGQVFQGDLAYLTRNKEKTSYKRFLSLCMKLFVMGLALSTTLYFIGPILIQFFFGSDWVLSGEFIKILSPLVFIMVIVTPISTALYVYKKHATLFFSQFLFFTISLSSFMFAGIVNDVIVGIVLFSTFSCFRYAYIYVKVKKAVLHDVT